jgi:predicted lactoylglutathione lyase
MEPQINIVTLGVNDLEIMAEWYQSKFGWSPIRNNDGTITFRLTNMVLILVQEKKLARKLYVWHDGKGFKRVVLTIGFNSEKHLQEAFDELEDKGVLIIRPPERSADGVYKGYISDMEDNFWELAYYPFVEMDYPGSNFPLPESVFHS